MTSGSSVPASPLSEPDDADHLRVVLAIEDHPDRGEVRIIPVPGRTFQTWVQAQPLSRAQRAAMTLTWLDPAGAGLGRSAWGRCARHADVPERRVHARLIPSGAGLPFHLVHNRYDESRADLTLERLALGVRAVFDLDVPDSPHAPGLGQTVPRPAERQASADPTATYLQVAAVAWEQERLQQVFASEGTLVPTVAPRARL